MHIIDNYLARAPLESMAEMPEMLIVGNLEDAERLRRKNSPFQRLVVFFPGLIKHHQERWIPLAYLGYGIRGIRVEPNKLSANMARLYFKSGGSPELARRALQNLDHEIRDTSERRAREMDRLCRSAQVFDVEPSPSVLGDFVKQIISSQFEFPELLIREAVQNADGAWDKKSENRIDVVLDAASRTITVSDDGRGMSAEVVESAFFSLYASLNEHLDYAAGKFGLGTASFFGADHEQIVLDTRTREGAGAYVVVDSDLNREPDGPPKRLRPGTTLSIKFKASSPIDFDRLEQILRADCAYLETPLYLHKGGNAEPINIELLPIESADTVRIEEPQIQGYLRRCEGPGVLHILCHRIRLSSIPTVGYSGAINCSALETTLSRDSVMDDPILHHALEVARLKAERLLQPTTVHPAALSLGTRARLYRRFVMTQLLQHGAVNEPFCRQHFGELVQWKEPECNPKSLLSGVFYTTLSAPLIVARCVGKPSPVSATIEALCAWFAASARGSGTLAALPMFMVTVFIATIFFSAISAHSMDSRMEIYVTSAFLLLPLWLFEFFFWWVVESVPRAAAKWAFHLALRRDGDWFSRRAPFSGMLKNTAKLTLVLAGLWAAACELEKLPRSWSEFLSSLHLFEVAVGKTIASLGSELHRIPWTWLAGALVVALTWGAWKKWRLRCKLQFSAAPLSAEQQALIARVRQVVGVHVPIGYSRGLTRADAKTYFVGQRICLNPARSGDLNAHEIAFGYYVKRRRDYSQASRAVCS